MVESTGIDMTCRGYVCTPGLLKARGFPLWEYNRDGEVHYMCPYHGRRKIREYIGVAGRGSVVTRTVDVGDCQQAALDALESAGLIPSVDEWMGFV